MSKQKNQPLSPLRHSVEHVLTQAMYRLFPDIRMAMGPATDDGFYFDFESEAKISPENFPKIEKEMKKIITQNLPIIHEEVTIEEARKLFEGNPYKQEWLDEIEAKGEKPTLYWTGEPEKNLTFAEIIQKNKFVDLCAGPHVESTKDIKAFKLVRVAGAYWRGDEKNQMLTRIYGTAFESQAELDEYMKKLKYAEENNHRKIGKEMELFTIFNEVGQGLPIWLPQGFRLRKTLEDYMIHFEQMRGYDHIITPHINREELFQKSGHLSHYQESMYTPIEIDDEKFYLKPMNCPVGMMVYNMKPRSYRDLPIKLGEFGTVYRYEKSGELHGLQRVRGFTQNDAHIFCTPEQLEKTFMEVLEMLEIFYRDLGFKNYKYRLSLSDKESDKYVGEKAQWQQAEETLKKVLEKNQVDFYEAPGEAAFYGPKLDVQAVNLYGKEDSISTIQFDFNLPERFDLSYIDKDGEKKRPFVIHRALIGSFERFFAFLIEYYAGRFPLWLAPTQIKIVSVSEKHNDYCIKMADEFRAKDYRVEIDTSDETVGKKIKKATLEKVPYMLVVGDKEAGSDQLIVRARGSRETTEFTRPNFFAHIDNLISSKSLEL